MKHLKYLCTSWQGFIQQIVSYANNGYCYYNFHIVDEKRRHKLAMIDETIVTRYELGISKDVRYNRKKAGKVNYAYLRFNAMIIVLKTDGIDPSADKNESKPFKDFRQEPLILIPVEGGKLSLKIGKKNQRSFTVYFSRSFYKEIKLEFIDIVARKKNPKEIITKYKNLNNIPAYSGIIRQKKSLSKMIIRLSKKHGVAVNRGHLSLVTRLKKHIVYTAHQSR